MDEEQYIDNNVGGEMKYCFSYLCLYYQGIISRNINPTRITNTWIYIVYDFLDLDPPIAGDEFALTLVINKVGYFENLIYADFLLLNYP